MRYFFNPNCKKITGLKKHAYIDELVKDYDQDVRTFGMDPFVKVEVQTKQFIATSKPKEQQTPDEKGAEMVDEEY